MLAMNMGAEHLRAYLAETGETQSAFAARVGVTQPTVSKWLSGGVPPTVEPARAIERASGGRLAWSIWFGGEAEAASAGPKVAEEEADRAHHYRLLARLLGRGPDAGLLTAIAGLEGGDGALGAARERLARAAREAGDEAALEEEYFDLFIGVGRGELVPYGSFYLTGFLNEKPLAELRGDLAMLGVARQAGVAETEDHISALCDVMAGLILGEFGAIAEANPKAGATPGLGPQSAFFNRHVAPWAGRFFGDLEAAKSARFYAAVGGLGRALVEIDGEAFALAA